RKKKQRTGVYLTAEGTLFVPTEYMRHFHERARPIAVLARATPPLPTYRWKNWQAKFHESQPWLFDWLYHGPLPEKVRVYYPAWRRRQSTTPPGTFAPDDEMVAFRKESTPHAIGHAVINDLGKEANALRSFGEGPTYPANWLERHAEHDWFASWL